MERLSGVGTCFKGLVEEKKLFTRCNAGAGLRACGVCVRVSGLYSR